MSGAKHLLWASGVQHVYASKSVSQGHECLMRLGKIETDEIGRIRHVGDFDLGTASGCTPKPNRIEGWLILGDPDDPIVFAVDKDKGYVYTGGQGFVIAPDGSVHRLGSCP